jgi:pantoate kinase
VTRFALKALLAGSERRWCVTVDVKHDFPVSQGLGMSAAGALGPAIALAKAIGYPAGAAVKAAHMAELLCHGGLGGIPAILGGGLEVRRKAGIPPLGMVERTRSSAPVTIAFQRRSLPSPPLLSSPVFLRKVRKAGSRLLSEVPPPPLGMEELMEFSSEFTDAMGLAPPSLRRVIDGCRRLGYQTAQAMMGNALYASGDGKDLIRYLSGKGLSVVQARVGTKGAHVFSA